MGWARRGAAVVAALGALGCCTAAQAQVQATGTVSEVIDGDTVDVVRDDGGKVRVRLIGVDAPETDECGGDQATSVLEPYEGHRVTLTTDPTQDAVDRFGRVLAYADTDRRVDLGHQVIALGRARVFVFDNRPFQRHKAYSEAETGASVARRGTWRECGGDFHRKAGDEAESTVSRADEAEDRVRRFYSHVNGRRFSAAWALLSAGLRGRLGSYASWRSGYARTVGTKLNTVAVTLVGGGAVVRAAIRSRDRDVCTGRVGRRFFRVRWVLSRRGNEWVATGVTAQRVGGDRVRLRRSSCAAPKPRPSSAPRPVAPPREDGCHPSYSPCVPTGRDYDCGELDGPYTVRGSDPYKLDGDDDGVGCE